MEKKEAVTSYKPLGMCQRLFSAFNPALRPLRRLTFRQRYPTDGDVKDTTPPPPTAPVTKSSDVATAKINAPTAPPQLTVKEKAATTPAPAADVRTQMVKLGSKNEPVPPVAPPEKAKVTPPTTAASNFASQKTMPPAESMPMPQRVVSMERQETATASAPERPRKNINEKVDEYISRTRSKMRTSSKVGKTGTF